MLVATCLFIIAWTVQMPIWASILITVFASLHILLKWFISIGESNDYD